MRFCEAYREAVDWMYSDPKAVAMYAEKIHSTEDLIKQSIAEFHPKASSADDAYGEAAAAMADAVKLKYPASR